MVFTLQYNIHAYFRNFQKWNLLKAFCTTPVSLEYLEQQPYINNCKGLHILIWMTLEAVQTVRNLFHMRGA